MSGLQEQKNTIGSRLNGSAYIGEIDTSKFNEPLNKDLQTRGEDLYGEESKVSTTISTSKSETGRTGINRKFDSIMLGVSSAVCFGLLAGAVVGLWAVPIGTMAGFYITYKVYQESAR